MKISTESGFAMILSFAHGREVLPDRGTILVVKARWY